MKTKNVCHVLLTVVTVWVNSALLVPMDSTYSSLMGFQVANACPVKDAELARVNLSAKAVKKANSFIDLPASP
jgi:hypothetical protein